MFPFSSVWSFFHSMSLVLLTLFDGLNGLIFHIISS